MERDLDVIFSFFVEQEIYEKSEIERELSESFYEFVDELLPDKIFEKYLDSEVIFEYSNENNIYSFDLKFNKLYTDGEYCEWNHKMHIHVKIPSCESYTMKYDPECETEKLPEIFRDIYWDKIADNMNS